MHNHHNAIIWCHQIFKTTLSFCFIAMTHVYMYITGFKRQKYNGIHVTVIKMHLNNINYVCERMRRTWKQYLLIWLTGLLHTKWCLQVTHHRDIDIAVGTFYSPTYTTNKLCCISCVLCPMLLSMLFLVLTWSRMGFNTTLRVQQLLRHRKTCLINTVVYRFSNIQ